MSFSGSISSLTGFIIVEYGKDFVSTETMYMLSGALCVINLIVLYFFDDSPMVSKETKRLQKLTVVNTRSISVD